MTKSEALSTEFYEQLGPDGLAARTTADWDRAIVERLVTMLGPARRILDVGCGYGRIALPLAAAGYEVVGLDLSARLLRAAQQRAALQAPPVRWVQASMRQLPFRPTSFDVVLCLWTAFYELLTAPEQVATLKQIGAVLRPQGWALIEGPVHSTAVSRPARRSGTARRVVGVEVKELTNYYYRHDAVSFARLMRGAGIAQYRVYNDDWAGRARQFLWLQRSA